MKVEKFKKIKGFEGYEISDLGRLRNSKTGKFRKFRICAGYYDISLPVKINGVQKWKSFLIHRLVADYFIKNTENKPCVNHKDGNKLNNAKSNLEWNTYSENIQHSFDVLGQKGAKNLNRRKTVILIDEKGNEIEIIGIREAGRFLKTPFQVVQNAIKKGHKANNYQIKLKNVTL